MQPAKGKSGSWKPLLCYYPMGLLRVAVFVSALGLFTHWLLPIYLRHAMWMSDPYLAMGIGRFHYVYETPQHEFVMREPDGSISWLFRLDVRSYWFASSMLHHDRVRDRPPHTYVTHLQTWNDDWYSFPAGAFVNQPPPESRPGFMIDEVYVGWPFPYRGTFRVRSWIEADFRLDEQANQYWSERGATFGTNLERSLQYQDWKFTRTLWWPALKGFAAWQIPTLLVLLIGVAIAAVRWRREQRGLCVRCRYPITGLEQCPECGRAPRFKNIHTLTAVNVPGVRR